MEKQEKIDMPRLDNPELTNKTLEEILLEQGINIIYNGETRDSNGQFVK